LFRRQQFLALTGIRFIFRFGKSAARAAAWHTDDKFEATLPFVENDDRSRLGPLQTMIRCLGLRLNFRKTGIN
jgi:hypothetical protein